jgi:hypothetical protein
VDSDTLLRQHGLQVTAQRLAVRRAASDRPHSTADDIYTVVRGRARCHLTAGDDEIDEAELVYWVDAPTVVSRQLRSCRATDINKPSGEY